LLSAAFPPHVAAINLAAMDVVENEPERVKRLWDNAKYFKKEIESLGFDTGYSQTPIIPAIVGDSKKAQTLASRMYDEGIFALAIVFPMVARDKARIRNQMNAGMTRDDLDEILRVYEKLGKELKLI
jgi:glycine C-acetyltransferase